MRRPLRPTDEGLAAWVERWTPSDLSIWDHWRMSLPPELRTEGLFRLQAALCGLDALRSFENESLETEARDFREHLHAACMTYGWSLQLTNDLRAGSRDVGVEPLRSLDALRSSLADAAHVSERLLELNVIDAGLFHSSCDMFLRTIAQNDFFRPPRALEISNDPFVGLLRLNRLVGVAGQRLDEREGEATAMAVLAAVRRDLHELTHFIVAEGSDDVAEELAPALASLDDESMLPEGMADETEAAKERIRAGIRGLRSSLKRAAKRLRGFPDESEPPYANADEREPTRRHSERVPVDISRDVWAFRFIVHAFVAKANALLLDDPASVEPSTLEFVSEFVSHFRVFAPRLAKGTEYPNRGPLIAAVSALSAIDEVGADTLAEAIAECEPFAAHLESFLSERSNSDAVTFDKREAAEDLRGYLEFAKRQPEGLRDFG